MITTQNIRLHAKCLAILEMIQTVNNRISAAKADIRIYDNGDPLNFLRLFTDRDELVATVEHNKRVKERLAAYYADTLVALITPVISKTKYDESVPSGAAGTQTPGKAIFRETGGPEQIQGIAGQTRQFVRDQRSANCGQQRHAGQS
jgi:hypothetical protein